jgi:hypothetical protein
VGCPWALFADGSDPSGVVPCGVVAVVVVVWRPSEFWSDEPLCAVPMPLPALPTLLPDVEVDAAVLDGAHGFVESRAEFPIDSFAATPGSVA